MRLARLFQGILAHCFSKILLTIIDGNVCTELPADLNLLFLSSCHYCDTILQLDQLNRGRSHTTRSRMNQHYLLFLNPS